MTVSRKVDYVADSKSVGGRFESFAAHHFRAPSSRPTPSTARPRRVGRSCAPSAGSASSCRRRAGGVRPGSPRRHGGERSRGGEAVEAGGAGGGPSSRNFLWISPARSITWRRTEFWRRTGGVGTLCERNSPIAPSSDCPAVLARYCVRYSSNYRLITPVIGTLLKVLTPS